MKKLYSFVLLLLPFWVFAQNPDSLATAGQVDSLLKISIALTEKGNYPEAWANSTFAEKIVLEKLGKETPAWASVCANHGRVLVNQTKYAEAEKWHLEALALRERLFGKEHPDYAKSLSSLAGLHRALRQYEKAEVLNLEVLALREKIFGKEHPDYALTLMHLASLYRLMGKYEKAEEFGLEALATREKVSGKEDPEYANCLMTLANLYWTIYEYDKAEPFYLEAAAIKGKTAGLESLAYGISLNNLGALYHVLGKYEKAAQCYLKSKDIREKTQGKLHPEYTNSLNNLGVLYRDMGEMEKSEWYFLEYLQCLAKRLGTEHPLFALTYATLTEGRPLSKEEALAKERLLQSIWEDKKGSGEESIHFARVFQGLANLYIDMRNYAEAEDYQLKNLLLMERLYGQESKEFALCLQGLAGLYVRVQRQEAGDSLIFKALSIKEKILGRGNPEMVSILEALALVYARKEQFAKADSLFLETLALREKAEGKDGRNMPATLSSYGDMCNHKGDDQKALELYLRAKAIVEQKMGTYNGSYGILLGNLIRSYWKLGDYAAADSLLREWSAISKSMHRKAARHLSERELLAMGASNKDRLGLHFSFVQLHKSPHSTGSAYDNALFYKGLLLNESLRAKNLVLQDSVLTERYEALSSYHRRLAIEYAKPLTERKPVAELEAKANEVEKEIARSVAGFGEALQEVGWQEVQGRLKAGEAAIEFIDYQWRNPERTDSQMYAALVLMPGHEAPVFIPLFEEKALKSLLSAHAERRSDYVNELYTDLSPSKKSFYNLIWQPLEGVLGEAKTIYFSPSGLLHRLNIAAIALPSVKQGKSVLADRYRLVNLGSTRQLAFPQSTAPAQQDALLFGGIEYEADSSTMAVFASTPDGGLAARRGWEFWAGESAERGKDWKPLRWTGKEVSNLADLLKKQGFKANALHSRAASEEAFKAIGKGKASPRILHLATHGYFFDRDEERGMREGDGAGFQASEHPMIRSGLILAGGNHAWKTGKPFRPGVEDGVLTAYEISQMNLAATELVVLSACETGLGDIQGNEGVFGLQRAFKMAGAKYLVMSLWQVPDFQTQELMGIFYAAWLEQKMSIPDAFQHAQRIMRERYEHPYFWAGFVLME